MDLYAENVLDHYRHPHHKSPLAHPTVTHEETNMSCGDTLTVQLRLDGDRINEIGWQGEGCAISQAAMSMLSEDLAGKSLADLDALAPSHVYALLGVPIGERRLKCALLSLHAVKNAVRATRGEAPQSWNETLGEGAKSR